MLRHTALQWVTSHASTLRDTAGMQPSACFPLPSLNHTLFWDMIKPHTSTSREVWAMWDMIIKSRVGVHMRNGSMREKREGQRSATFLMTHAFFISVCCFAGSDLILTEYVWCRCTGGIRTGHTLIWSAVCRHLDKSSGTVYGKYMYIIQYILFV